MRIDSEVLAAFLHMQELDVQIIRAEKQLQELPERQAVADAMAKKRAVAAAMEQLEGIERSSGAAFSQKGGELKQRIADMQAKRKAMAQRVPADDMKLYERTAAATAGVPLALLVEERCGACRTPIEHGRVVDMRSQGNVATCPNCGRLLILQAH